MIRRSILCMMIGALCNLASPVAASFVVELGSNQADLAPGSGTTTATIDVTFRNSSMTTDAPFAAYSLFLDIGPLGLELPTGVTFGSPAVTYFSGNSFGPLPFALDPGTINLAPAKGDLGVGQLQLFDGMIGPSESFVMFQLNLVIDRVQANPGVFDIVLNPLGENTIDAILTGPLPTQQEFTFTNGSLTLNVVPEPEAWLILLVGVCTGKLLLQQFGVRRTEMH